MDEYIAFLKQVYDFYIIKSKKLDSYVNIDDFNEYYGVNDEYFSKYFSYLKEKQLLELIGCRVFSITLQGITAIEETFYSEKFIERQKTLHAILESIHSHPSNNYVPIAPIYDSLGINQWDFYFYLKQLNQMGLVKYVGSTYVKITAEGIDAITDGLFENSISELTDKRTIPISSEKPFDNELAMVELIKIKSHKKVYWLDRYFSEAGLKYLSNIDNSKVQNIEILTSREHINEGFKTLYKRLKSQLSIDVTINIITDKNKLDLLHDRYYCTYDKYDKLRVYNLPSPDTIKRGQMSDIVQIDRENFVVEFKELKNDSLDLNEFNGDANERGK